MEVCDEAEEGGGRIYDKNGVVSEWGCHSNIERPLVSPVLLSKVELYR